MFIIQEKDVPLVYNFENEVFNVTLASMMIALLSLLVLEVVIERGSMLERYDYDYD